MWFLDFCAVQIQGSEMFGALISVLFRFRGVNVWCIAFCAVEIQENEMCGTLISVLY